LGPPFYPENVTGTYNKPGFSSSGKSQAFRFCLIVKSGFFIAFSIISLSMLKGFVERDLDVILPRLLAYLNSKVTLSVTVILFSTIYIGSFFWEKGGVQASDTKVRHQVVNQESKGEDRPLG
jgi:hypothetical protein